MESDEGEDSIVRNGFRKLQELGLNEQRSLWLVENVDSNDRYLMVESTYFDITPKNIENLQNNIDKIKKLDHPALLPVDCIYIPSEDGDSLPCVYYKMPKCKSLAQCIDQIKIKSKKSLLDPTRILILIYGVSSALEYLHENGIVHGDLSPTTIFLNQSYEPLLSCYGINSINPQRRRLTKSSPQTISMAPELYERLSVPFTMETDIFAFGMFVFRVLSKSIIFQKDASTVSFSDNIISGLRPIIPKWLPPFLKNCIAQCWIQDKEDRPPMSEVSSQLLDGISTFCKGMNEDLFVPYLKKLSHPNLRTNVQPLTPPPRSPSRDFASPIQTVEEAKNSREYSLLFELQNISETGKNLALESMILSNCLLSVNEENKSDCKKWILDIVNFGNDFKVEWLVSNLFKASECRFRNNDNLVMLIKDILDNLDHSKGDNFVSEIQNHFFFRN